MQDVPKFYELGLQIVGSNFLKIPIQPVLEQGVFKHEFGVWFDPTKEHSIAQWILFYFERALWINYEAYVR